MEDSQRVTWQVSFIVAEEEESEIAQQTGTVPLA
jgi:hypothetical protein